MIFPRFLIPCFLLATASARDPSPLLARAERVLAEGRVLEARDTLARARILSTDPLQRAVIETRLGEINLALFLSRSPQPETETVSVRPGDTLGKIAARQGTTADYLRKANGIRGDVIHPGQRLKSPRARFTVHIDKAANRLELRLDGRFFKGYTVATGANNHTPVGTFRITDRVERPTWWRPSDGAEIPFGHPEHRIGTHWLAWDRKGFGIHGTDEPESIGQQASLGCVRMLNEEVGELYLLLPVGTVVTVYDRGLSD